MRYDLKSVETGRHITPYSCFCRTQLRPIQILRRYQKYLRYVSPFATRPLGSCSRCPVFVVGGVSRLTFDEILLEKSVYMWKVTLVLQTGFVGFF